MLEYVRLPGHLLRSFEFSSRVTESRAGVIGWIVNKISTLHQQADKTKREHHTTLCVLPTLAVAASF